MSQLVHLFNLDSSERAPSPCSLLHIKNEAICWAVRKPGTTEPECMGGVL